jgi:protein SCO1/2
MAESPVDGRFDLIDHHGQRVTEQTYRGRWMLVYFGFTNCRSVCPRTLTKLSDSLERLGELSDRIEPLYITVDPERDTPEVMRAFLEDRFPRFTGLTGSEERVTAAKAAYRVFSQRGQDPLDPDGYAVPHSAITYLVDPHGDYADHFVDTVDAETIAGRVRAKLEPAR